MKYFNNNNKNVNYYEELVNLTLRVAYNYRFFYNFTVHLTITVLFILKHKKKQIELSTPFYLFNLKTGIINSIHAKFKNKNYKCLCQVQ